MSKLAKTALCAAALGATGITLNFFAQEVAQAVPMPFAAFLVCFTWSLLGLCWPLILTEAARDWRAESSATYKGAIVMVALVAASVGLGIAALGFAGTAITLGEKAGGFDTIGLMAGALASAVVWVWHSLSIRKVISWALSPNAGRPLASELGPELPASACKDPNATRAPHAK
jgi:hypothetical protein